jgi:UAA transporter family
MPRILVNRTSYCCSCCFGCLVDSSRESFFLVNPTVITNMVDFVDLAESSRWLIDRVLRSQDDDFVNLEAASDGATPFEAGAGAAAAAAKTSPTSDNILTSIVYEDGYTATATLPLLSKSAEAELYLLATNFLLYVAMVIITIIIAKIYFPESLERGSVVPSVPRKYAYRRQVNSNNSNSANNSSREEESSYEVADEEEDEMEALYSDGEDSREDDDGVHASERLTGHGGDDQEEDDPLFSDATAGSSSPRRILEFDQEKSSRAKVVQRLLFCSLMLNLTFVTWGALQERMLTRRYPRYTGDYFTYSYALVFTNRFWTLVMSGLLLLYLKPRLSRSTVIYEYSFPSISNMLSSWCQYEALRYVSFPATTLFKSFKLAPVMLMGKILGNKSCT